MSFDIAVFEPSAAPRERGAFENWFAEQADWSKNGARGNPSIVSPALQSWCEDIQKTFPNLNGPDTPACEETRKEDYLADYSVGKHVIYISFSRAVTDEAKRAILRTASLHKVGVYDLGEGRIFYPKDCDMPQIKVTYEDEVYSGTSELTLYETLDLFDGMKWKKGSFLHFSIDETRLFQLFGERGGILVMEFTEMGVRESFLQKRANKEKCREMLYEIFGNKNVERKFMEGFQELSVSEKNKLINRLILIGILLALFGAIAYFICTFISDFSL